MTAGQALATSGGHHARSAVVGAFGGLVGLQSLQSEYGSLCVRNAREHILTWWIQAELGGNRDCDGSIF